MSYAHGTIIYTESYSPREKGKHITILSANVRKLQLFFPPKYVTSDKGVFEGLCEIFFFRNWESNCDT